ncbi:hypothetical protein FC48_GL001016 [Ligilactobacillus murinus DSM 20452 = NBRC 14221]|uniref:Uncharacterized protein n=1 Tax=Ligilactobacillus murinus DSM 20452 = NBRC 14221 TaxID=1423772 RepID=A0A0R2BCV6_9LACO|nr:hypothetical protein FC48_GL001016 [Ligilactobacillus murinus DSM 20452 = NBRC 14221]
MGTITKEDRNHSYTHQGRSYKYDLTTAENTNVVLFEMLEIVGINCSGLLRSNGSKW